MESEAGEVDSPLSPILNRCPPGTTLRKLAVLPPHTKLGQRVAHVGVQAGVVDHQVGPGGVQGGG
jgi:hypothetical protein